MEQPLLKLCIVSPSWRPMSFKCKVKRFATAEPTNGLCETSPLGLRARNKKPSLSSTFIRSQSFTYVSRFATGHMVGLSRRLTMNALEFPPRSVLPNVWLKIKPSWLGNRPTSLVNVLPRSVALSAEKNSRQKKARSRAAVYLWVGVAP